MQSNFEIVIFRYNNEQTGSFIDIYNNQYTGTIFTGIEDMVDVIPVRLPGVVRPNTNTSVISDLFSEIEVLSVFVQDRVQIRNMVSFRVDDFEASEFGERYGRFITQVCELDTFFREFMQETFIDLFFRVHAFITVLDSISIFFDEFVGLAVILDKATITSVGYAYVSVDGNL